jgi:hypothetical protein
MKYDHFSPSKNFVNFSIKAAKKWDFYGLVGEIQFSLSRPLEK